MAANPNQRTLNGRLEPLSEVPPYSSGLFDRLGVLGLHCGSGVNLHTGWLNTDLIQLMGSGGGQSSPGRIVRWKNAYYLQHHAGQPYPMADQSMSRVFAEHFLEHLPGAEAIAWLREVRRLLKPGGIVRISTPDLEKYIRGYLDANGTFFQQHRQRLQQMGVTQIPPGRAGMVNQIFYFWGHHWLYDQEELVRAAATAGFQPDRVRFTQFRRGQDSKMAALDLPIRNDESLYAEIPKD
jgi:predicted SAM-dependent methyltransferase